MRRVVLLAIILLPIHTIVLTAQREPLRVLALGQLNGPQLRLMAAGVCGPYFTLTPTDSAGGGLLHLAVESDTRELQVITILLGAVQLKICETCLPPTAVATIDAESSLRMEVSMPRAYIKLSPCLRHARLIK